MAEEYGVGINRIALDLSSGYLIGRECDIGLIECAGMEHPYRARKWISAMLESPVAIKM